MEETPNKDEITISNDGALPDRAGKEKKAPSVKREILEWVFAILVAVAVTLIIKFFVFDIVRVDGHSMESTLQNEDKIILWKLGYEPKRQDIIVLDSNYKDREAELERRKEEEGMSGLEALWFELFPPEEYKNYPYIKRVIGLPGDEIDIRDNQVYVNGELLEEPYLDEGIAVLPNQLEVPVTVPEGYIFVMGDNRPKSLDSRSDELGFVPLEAVAGKAVFRILPFSSFGTIQ